MNGPRRHSLWAALVNSKLFGDERGKIVSPYENRDEDVVLTRVQGETLILRPPKGRILDGYLRYEVRRLNGAVEQS